LGVKMSPMYERIDRGVWLTIPGDRTFFNLLLTSSPAINGYAEYEGNNLLLVSVRVKYMIYLFGMGRIWTVQKIFTVQKKCHTHLVSFITHHGLFVLYIVEIFNCKKCHIHMVINTFVSFTKHHLGANPRTHVKHYSCSTLENFLLLFDSNVRIINTKKQA
jgi:hypothetical protein